jgi:hypothetical protein
LLRPRASRATTVCVVCIRAATCSYGSPARARAAIKAEAKEDLPSPIGHFHHHLAKAAHHIAILRKKAIQSNALPSLRARHEGC